MNFGKFEEAFGRNSSSLEKSSVPVEPYRNMTAKEKELEKALVTPPSGYRDVWAMLLFYAHLAVSFGLFLFTVRDIDFSRSGTPKGPSQEPVFPQGRVFYYALGLNAVYTLALVTLICAVYMILLNRYPRKMILGSVITTMIINLALSIYFFFVGAYTPAIMVLVLLLLSAFVYFSVLRHRIDYSALILETCVGILQQYKAVFFAPFIGFILTNGYMLFASLGMIGVASKYGEGGVAIALVVYYLFSIFWSAQVVLNTVHVIISGVISTYYFVHESGSARLAHPTRSSSKRALTTSFGSICFGSLFVAVIQLISALVRNARQDRDNFLALCASCLLRLLEDVVRYFNKYAFTQVAIYGKPYIQAAKDTWALAKSSGIELLVNDNILGYVFGIASLASGLLCAGFAYLTNMWHTPAWSSEELLALCFVSFILGLVSMAIVSETINSSVSTLLVCFCEDPEALRRTKPELHQRFVTVLGRGSAV